MNTAHITEVKGKSAELIARLALMSNGWIVAKPDTDESFDIVARDPLTGEWKTFQVKSIRQRFDRDGEMVVAARKSNGEPYAQSDVDYFIGVMGAEEDTLPRVWMFENRGLTEYWAGRQRADKRWVRLPIDMQREYYEPTICEAEGESALCVAA